MYCLCKVAQASGSYVTFSDGVDHCLIWRQKAWTSNLYIYTVPFLIANVNYAAKITMKYISSFEKQHSLPAQIYMSTALMTSISFMNIGVIIVLVSINIGHYLPVPIFQGRYANFSVKWY